MGTDSDDVVSPASSDGGTDNAAAWPAIHDALQQARILRQVLQEGNQRIGCFLGAGCPLGIYDQQGKATITLIPAVLELTRRVAEGLKEADKPSQGKPSSNYFSHWELLAAECRSGVLDPTVEDVLTELRTLTNRRGNAEVLGVPKSDFVALDVKICELIASEVNKRLPSYRNAYTRFASWIAGIQRHCSVEVFTPNYDVLLEEAFEQHPLPHFDGFVGSHQPWFDLASIEHDVLPPRWTRLWKLHGSINWERSEEIVAGVSVTRVVRVTRDAKPGKVMIYPSHLKYDQSRRMPYLAMLDRLRAFFHGNDAPRLLICGYSFLDEHLNEVLLDGLRGNRSAQCFALMYGGLDAHSRAVEYARKQGNLTVIARDGAVVGTRAGSFRKGADRSADQSPWIETGAAENGSSPSKEVISHLGDFHFFGLFLEQISGGTIGEQNVPHDS